MDFFRFPHTPHLAWLGPGRPREDKVLSRSEVDEVLLGPVLVEEKVDGANVGFSVDPDGALRIQNRGTYLAPQSSHPQFKPLFRWLHSRRLPLADALFPDLVLFGEWCWAVHNVRYDRLPDWFLAFDVYDRGTSRFWSAERRNELVASLGIVPVPEIARGQFSLRQLIAMLGQSRVAVAPAEGLYVRRDEGDWLAARAKLVRPEFTQTIGEHWSSRSLEQNSLRSPRGDGDWT